MSTVTVFYIPSKDPPAYYFFDFLDLITGFLDLF